MDPEAMDTRPMVPLGEVLHKLQTLILSGGQQKSKPSDEANDAEQLLVAVPLERLRETPPTAALLDRQAAIEAALQLMPAGDSVRRRQAERDLVHTEARLDWARQRDAIQAERPEGCTCLGLGGFGARGLPPMDDEQVEATRVWETYCHCPDGARASREDAQARSAYRAWKEDRRLNRAVSSIGVENRFAGLTFTTYPVTRASQPSFDLVKAWAERHDDRSSLYLYGQYGCGKTGLAVSALAERLPHIERSALFRSIPELIANFRAVIDGEGSEADILQLFTSVRLLVLDDIGGDERLTDWGLERLSMVVNRRHSMQLPTIFTSNHSLAELMVVLKSPRLGNRIAEMCKGNVIELRGPNLRVSGGAA